MIAGQFIHPQLLLIVNNLERSSKKKLYISDDDNPVVFDPVSNSWSSWPAPSMKTGDGACLVAWKDTFLSFGGSLNRRVVQVFNHSSNTWKVLDSSSVPIDIRLSSCILLPTDEILVVGSEDTLYQSSAAVYNIRANTWKKLPDTTVSRQGTSLVSLGTRVFAICGEAKNVIEEFDYSNYTWSYIEAKLIVPRYHHGTIALPSEILQHVTSCMGVK